MAYSLSFNHRQLVEPVISLYKSMGVDNIGKIRVHLDQLPRCLTFTSGYFTAKLHLTIMFYYQFSPLELLTWFN